MTDYANLIERVRRWADTWGVGGLQQGGSAELLRTLADAVEALTAERNLLAESLASAIAEAET